MSRLKKLLLSPFVVPGVMVVVMAITSVDAAALGATEACCFDPSGCQDLTPTFCANAGGISRGPGTSCATEDCSSQGACCQGAGICEELSEFICENGGGTFQRNATVCQATESSCNDLADNDCDGAKDCADSTCAGTAACIGACCNPDGSCDEGVSSVACHSGGGSYFGNTTTCTDAPCMPTIGLEACCFAPSGCSDLRPSDCANAGGIARGPDTRCSFEQCYREGACCQGVGICEAGLSRFICENGGGTYQGDYTLCQATEISCGSGGDNDCDGAANCADNDCAGTPPCAGACCHPDGSCTFGVSGGACTGGGGTYQGNTTTCANVTCPQPTGACCRPNNSCVLLTEGQCAAISVSGWAGPLTTCSDPFPASEIPGSTCCDGLDNDCDGLADLGDFGDPDCAGTPCVQPPLAVPSGQLACRKNRYICFQTNNPGWEIAIEIQRTSEWPMTGYAGPPDVDGNSAVYPAAVFRNDWPATLCVGDCEISPVQNFIVRVIPGPAPGGTPSQALALQTAPQPGPKPFGDTTGSFNSTMPNQWDCPNGVQSTNDFQMALQKFAGVATAPHNTMSNIQGVGSTHPCLNSSTSISDVFLLLKAFQGERYPFYICSGNRKTCSKPGEACPTAPGDAMGTGVCELPTTASCPPNTGSPNCPP